jgi:uncharacterized repeat protein (TIGR01451 family)
LKTRINHPVLLTALMAALGWMLAGGFGTARAASADLSLSVSVGPQYIQFYSNIVFTVTVSNAGPSTATGVVVSNQIPTKDGLPSLNFVSASDGSTPTNGVLLVNLGSLAVGATNSIQITGQITTNLFSAGDVEVGLGWCTNVFQVYASQTDPVPTNNTAAVVVVFAGMATTVYTTSTRTIETNLTATVNRQATNYSTELIAKLPNGTVVYDQTFNAAYSDPTVQAAVTQAAGNLTGAGATSYSGPTQTSFLQNLEGNSSVTVTNAIGSDVTVATTTYIGPQTIMVSINQSEPYFLAAGHFDVDTLITTVVTNLVATTNTSTYLASAVYVMTGIVAQASADLSLSVSVGPQYLQIYSNIVYTITVSNAGPSAATGVVVSNQIPVSVNFLSATGGSTPTNGVLLVPLGSLAAGATNSIQITGQITTNLYSGNFNGGWGYWFTNVFQVFADQTDPVPANNTDAVVSQWLDGTTIYTTSTRTIETNLTAAVSQQVTNYSTELIAVMPGGSVVFDQTFNAAYSDSTVQAAVTQAAAALTGAGANSYTGPTQTNFLQTLTGNSSVTVTNAIGTGVSFATSLYIGPTTIMVSANQSELYFVVAGQQDYDTLVTSVITNLVTTTITNTYLNTAVYVMTGVVAQADLSLSVAIEPYMVNTNITYTITVSNAGPSAATGMVVSNQVPPCINFISATGGSTPTNGILLIDLGSLAAGATNSLQITGLVTTNLLALDANMVGHFTNVFQVIADQADPDLTNNTATVISETGLNITTYTSSTHTIQTNLTSAANQQATNYSTALIAVMPDGTVVFTQTLAVPFSDPTVQTAVATAATGLTNAGASAYTGPTKTSFFQNFEGSSSVTVTNLIGTNISFATTVYIGPQMIMVDTDQSVSFIILPGDVDVDTLITTVLTNLVTTTFTSNYLNSSVYMMTGIVAQASADLSLSVSIGPQYLEIYSNVVYTITVSNAGPSTATGVVVSNRVPVNESFVSATGGSVPSGGVLLVNLGSLAVGATNAVQVLVQPTVAGQLTNLFQVFASTVDPVLTNNSATVVSTVTNAPAVISGMFYNEFSLGTNGLATAINSSGQLVGAGPAFWTNYSALPVELKPLTTGGRDFAYGINDLGQIVGSSGGHAVYWTNYESMPVDLEELGGPINTNNGSTANAINVAGQIVGQADFTHNLPHAAYWPGSSSPAVDLGALGGSANSSRAYSINGSGQMVGYSSVGGHQRATYWTNGSSAPLDLGTLGGNVSDALAINDAGEIVGVATTTDGRLQAAYWTNASSPAVALAPLCGTTNSFGSAINNAGQIVGFAIPGTNVLESTAVIWRNHTSLPVELTTLILSNTPGFNLSLGDGGTAINDSGEIVTLGYANGSVSNVTDFVLVPTNATINAYADLSLSASAAPEPVGVGSNLVYSITVSNAGPMAASDVVVSNQLPAGVNFISATGDATPLGGVLMLDFCSPAAGATHLVQIIVQPTAAGKLTNTFAVFADETDPDLANNSATVISTVTNAAQVNLADLSLTARAMYRGASPPT